VREKIDLLLKNPSGPVELAALKVAIKLGITEAAAIAFTLVADGERSGRIRTEALRALSTLKSGRLTEAVKLALADKDETLRTEATKIQAQLKPSDAGARLRATLERGTTREKQSAFATIAGMPGSAADEILAQWLERLNEKQVPAELQLDLIEAAGKRQAREVKDRLTRFERARPADDDLRAYRECLTGGNSDEGRKIFIERQDVFCVRCHKVNGEGGEAGPELTGLAARQNREYILESIVYPNKRIAPGFESLLLTMKNGVAYAGIVKAETESDIDIISPEDGPMKLKKEEIRSRERGPSAMPEELRQVLSKRDLRDLVEFLATLK
jgi:quinoprotein glucose dehydrogenase